MQTLVRLAMPCRVPCRWDTAIWIVLPFMEMKKKSGSHSNKYLTTFHGKKYSLPANYGIRCTIQMTWNPRCSKPWRIWDATTWIFTSFIGLSPWTRTTIHTFLWKICHFPRHGRPWRNARRKDLSRILVFPISVLRSSRIS